VAPGGQRSGWPPKRPPTRPDDTRTAPCPTWTAVAPPAPRELAAREDGAARLRARTSPGSSAAPTAAASPGQPDRTTAASVLVPCVRSPCQIFGDQMDASQGSVFLGGADTSLYRPRRQRREAPSGRRRSAKDFDAGHQCPALVVDTRIVRVAYTYAELLCVGIRNSAAQGGAASVVVRLASHLKVRPAHCVHGARAAWATPR